MTRLTGALLCVLPLTLMAACGEVPDAPQMRPQYSAANGDMSKLAKYRNGPPTIVIGFAMKTICANGGTLSFIGFQVDVPKGAVTKCTNFTIRLPVDPKMSNYVWAEFGPHGQKFAVPITLTLPLKGTTAEGDNTVHVLWFDGQQWIEQKTTPTLDGRIQTQTNHFSDYGTEQIQPSKGIIVTGG